MRRGTYLAQRYVGVFHTLLFRPHCLHLCRVPGDRSEEREERQERHRSVSEVYPKCVRRVGGVKYWYVSRICLLTLPRLPNQPRVLPVAEHWLVGSLPTTVAIEEVGLYHHKTATTNTKPGYQSEKTEIQQPTATNNNQPTQLPTTNHHPNPSTPNIPALFSLSLTRLNCSLVRRATMASLAAVGKQRSCEEY